MDPARLRDEVLRANLALPANGLVKLTWGNVSGVDREHGVMAIKASGVAYERMTADDVVLVDLESGEVVESRRRPSTDTPTHAALYRAFDSIGGIVHTHSTWATAWAQAGMEIPLLGTTHADLMADAVPVSRPLTAEEVDHDYEGETGTVLIELVAGRVEQLPGALVRGHGPFCWGVDPAAAVQSAVTLEEVAKLALLTRLLSPEGAPLDSVLRDKHHQRKHGPDAYYGQS